MEWRSELKIWEGESSLSRISRTTIGLSRQRVHDIDVEPHAGARKDQKRSQGNIQKKKTRRFACIDTSSTTANSLMRKDACMIRRTTNTLDAQFNRRRATLPHHERR